MGHPFGLTTYRKKINDGLRRVQRAIATRVIAGYRTVSADAALLLARIAPAPLQAAYYKRVFIRIHELKRRGEYNKLEEKDIKMEEKTPK